MDRDSFLKAWRAPLVVVVVIAVSLIPIGAFSQSDRAEILARAQSLRSSEPESALRLLEPVLDGLQTERVEVEEADTIAKLLELRVAIQRGRGRYAAASADAQQLAVLAERFDDQRLAASAAFLQGSIEAEQGQFSQALDRFHAARRRLEGSGLPRELARILNAIGVTHNFIGDQERAREYYQSALDSARAANDDRMAGTYLGNLALSVAQLEGPAAAVPLLREVLRLGEETGVQIMVTMARANLCDQLVELGQQAEAEIACLAALEEVDRMGEARWQAGIRLALGNLRASSGLPENAVEWYREALTIASSSVPTIEDEVLEALIETLADLGQAPEALALANRRIALRDERQETSRRALVEELEVRYEVERSEGDLSLLRLQSELQSTQIRQRNQLVVALLVILLVAVIAAIGALRSYRIKAGLERDLALRNRDLEKALDHINDLASHDSLTGLLNRRALEELGAKEVSRQQRHGGALSLMLMDIDYFKAINDRYGHSVGDEALRGLARILKENMRDSDLVGRWGGEEFLCILPNTDVAEAQQTAKRIRSALKSALIHTSDEPVRLTLTCGIAAVEEGRLADAIQKADQAMYQGKHDGRNAIKVADPNSPDDT